MLVITRNLGDSFRIGDEIVLTVTGVAGRAVKFGIDAPKEVEILREEIYQGSNEANQQVRYRQSS